MFVKKIELGNIFEKNLLLIIFRCLLIYSEENKSLKILYNNWEVLLYFDCVYIVCILRRIIMNTCDDCLFKTN